MVILEEKMRPTGWVGTPMRPPFKPSDALGRYYRVISEKGKNFRFSKSIEKSYFLRGPRTAITAISTAAPAGRLSAPMVARAGKLPVKYLP